MEKARRRWERYFDEYVALPTNVAFRVANDELTHSISPCFLCFPQGEAQDCEHVIKWGGE